MTSFMLKDEARVRNKQHPLVYIGGNKRKREKSKEKETQRSLYPVEKEEPTRRD